MFGDWNIRIVERMTGRKILGIVAEISRGGVTERTLRNWVTNAALADAARMGRFRLQSRDWVARDLAAKGWPTGEIDTMIAGLSDCPGMVSSLMFGMQGPHHRYVATVQMASAIDHLDNQLVALRSADDLPAFVTALLAAPFLEDAHFIHPEKPDTAEVVRTALADARSWEALAEPLGVLFLNVSLHLLATLDLEFCAHFLPTFAATPVFAALQPRTHSSLTALDNRIPLRRDLFHYPARRLLELVACMRDCTTRGAWPRAVPPPKSMAIWLELAGEPALAGNLVRWRRGRGLTLKQFDAVWDACFSVMAPDSRPAAPIPMLYATALFTELFVKGKRETGDLCFIVPDGTFYQRWWDFQHEKLTTGSGQLRFGSEPWMPGLL